MIAQYTYQNKQTGQIHHILLVDQKREADIVTIEDQAKEIAISTNMEIIDYKYKERGPIVELSNLKFKCKYCKKQAIHKSTIRITECKCGALHRNPIYIKQGRLNND